MTERDLNLMENNLGVAQGGLTPGQRGAICFAAGVIGALVLVNVPLGNVTALATKAIIGIKP